MNILALNVGSATLKYKLFTSGGNGRATDDLVSISHGDADHSGSKDIVQAAVDVIAKCKNHGIDAVGFRIVHGGATFYEPTQVNADVLRTLKNLKDLDPTHEPAEVELIDATMKELPETPLIAVFDTSFHHTLPEVAWRYALPKEFADRLGLRRYGFHGISHSFVSKELLKQMGLKEEGTRLIVCHLGSGASLCAVADGKSMDTSMGMTPLEGLVMGTRAGDIDPGLILALLQEHKITVESLATMMNGQSGLLGLSAKSSDVRELETSASSGDHASELALEIFAYRVKKYIGSYVAALGGIDGIAFAGGIGENSPSMRSRICQGLEFLGIRLSERRNFENSKNVSREIGDERCAIKVWVIPTDEELEVARQTFNLLRQD